MNDIVFTLEFDDLNANDHANEYLQKGWTLLHVGTKAIGEFDNGQPNYSVAYVVGANQEQFDKESEQRNSNYKENISNYFDN